MRGPTKPVLCRLSGAAKARLDALAAVRGVSLSDIVDAAIVAYTPAPVAPVMANSEYTHLRLKTGLSMAAVARKSGVHVATIERIEAGKTVPSLPTRMRILAVIAPSSICSLALRLLDSDALTLLKPHIKPNHLVKQRLYLYLCGTLFAECYPAPACQRLAVVS
jgi:transcriptional regulator with XRE-family HTH domain